MKLITVIIICGFTITSAIRVPPSWNEKRNVQQTRHKFRTTGRPSVRSEIGLQSRPHGAHAQKHNKINSGRKYQQDVRQLDPKKTPMKKEFKPSATMDGWKPIFPAYMVPEGNSFSWQSFQPSQPKPVQISPLQKNYRDDKTHEPADEEIEEKHTSSEKPLSTHEVPLDIPTRPIYPGEGQWAKRGKKHRPFVSKHKFTKLEEDEEDKRPDGYETFEKNEKLFEKQRGRFRENINEFPQKHKFIAQPVKDSDYDAEDEEEENEDEDEEKQEFVPTKLYTQVRRSENEKYLPRLSEDPRLREVIKDSKIQTVYTEEGYEDLAYDHAGHEKTAEEAEGYAEFEKEIEKEKEKRARNQDSESAGSQHQFTKKPLKMNKDKLLKTKEITMTALKDKKIGGTELEVSTEVKILETPNNETETHKYVKIFPKIYRYDKVTTEKGTAASEESTKSTPYYRSRYRRRYKRYTNDFPKITVDTDFIDKINHNLPKKIKKFEKPKYPYYNDPTVNPDSPLRYAEDLDNIPKKTEDEFAFYNQAEKTECPEVETDVNPIPERIINADKDPENTEEATDVELVQGPRLKNLGDKIDCFKVKYFGENPLDSPFFQEKEIGPVVPIFKEIVESEKALKQVANLNEIEEERSYSKNVPVRSEVKEEDLNILEDVIKQFNMSENSEATTQSVLKLELFEPKAAPSVNVENQTENSVISIITTPKYTIDLKPKHIYDQIELLEYLPYRSNKTEDQNSTTTTTETSPNHRLGKSLEEEEETTATTAKSTEEAAPESQPLKQRRRPRPRPRPRRPPYQIFDVNQYLPRNPYTVLNRIVRTSTVLPKGTIKSEVHYKDEIKASEQLNVFADVINNIKNSRDPHQIGAPSNRVVTKLNLLDNHRKIPVVETTLDDIEETNSFYLTTSTTTTSAPPRGTIKYSWYTTKEKAFEDMANRDKAKYENLELLKIKRVTSTTEPYSSNTRISVEEEEGDDEEDENTTVLGLMPPVPPNQYTTIIRPQIIKPTLKESKLNLFYVLGMKPPSPKQKIYSYSDFKNHQFEKPKRALLRRGKRGAQRPAYSEVVRNRNKPIDVDDDTEVVVADDDDDYVPHRPKNYHYDEKTGKIVYDKTTTTEASEEEYIEVTEAPIPKPTRRNSVTAPSFEPFTGPSFVDYIKQLKANSNYTEIPDPPSTEKEEETTTSATTAKPVSTDAPEFLSFLSKLKSDSNYKAIADKTTSKTTTTTEAIEEVEVEEEETQLENVQNSPGGQSTGQMFQIFDINEYLPKVKNYTPRTSIDYSKYKTIERAPVPLRHNLSSRYNSEEEELENVKTSRVPILLEEKKEEDVEINPEVSESKKEEVEPTTTTVKSTTTRTASSATTTRRRTRPKSRGNRRSTTLPSVTITSEVVTEEISSAPINKPKRIYPRRRPTRIKLDRTTTEESDSVVEESTSSKVIRRRHQKSEDLDSTTTTTTTTTSTTTTEKPNYKIEIPDKQEVAKLNRTNAKNRTKIKDGDVQVFQKYDQSKKHGGDYKKENEESESKNVDEVKRLTDVVAKPSTYYTDPKLPKKINQLIEDRGVESGIEEEDENEEKEDEENAEFDYEGAEEKVETTKKPFFVKDPDKRMYFYAPV